MGHCSRCGQPLIEGMAFCGRCGTAVAPPAAAEPPLAAVTGSHEVSHQGAGQVFPVPGAGPQAGYAPAPAGYAQPGYGQPGPGQTGFNQPLPQEAVGQAPQFAFRIPITAQDAMQWLRGAGVLLLVTVASGFIIALLLGLFLSSANHGNPGDWFAAGFLGAGMALGGRVGVSGSSIDAGDATFTASFNLRVSVLLITIAVLVAVRLLARRSERGKTGSSLKELTVRALGTSLVFTVAMAILALAVHIHALYGFSPFGGVAVDGAPTIPGGQSVGSTSGALVLSAGSLFLWPLLLVVTVWWGSAFAVWLRTGSTTAPNPAAMRLAWLWTCRPAFLAVRAQVLATTVLAGVGTYVYAVIETLQRTSQAGTDSGLTTRIVLGLLLGLPNIAALAGSVSLGVPLAGFGPFDSVLGVVGNIDPTNIDPNSTGGTPYTSTLSVAGSNSFGFFGDQHPAVIYLLVAASVLGTLGAAKWAVSRSWDRSRALLGPGQAWRGAVFGALLWALVGFAAQLTENTSVMDMGTNLSIGPSLPGLLLGGAIWGLATCLAMSYFAGHLTATPVVQTGPVNPGEAGAGGGGGTGAAVPAQFGPAGSDEDVVDMGTVITLAAPDPDEED